MFSQQVVQHQIDLATQQQDYVFNSVQYHIMPRTHQNYVLQIVAHTASINTMEQQQEVAKISVLQLLKHMPLQVQQTGHVLLNVQPDGISNLKINSPIQLVLTHVRQDGKMRT